MRPDNIFSVWMRRVVRHKNQAAFLFVTPAFAGMTNFWRTSRLYYSGIFAQLFVVFFFLFFPLIATAAELLHFHVEPAATVKDVWRFGVNLGTWTSWGAEQLSANVLKNPGFEGVSDRSLVVVKGFGSHRFTDDAEWLARPDGFWAGARYDVRTGAAAGASGRIMDSRRAGRGGLPEFITEEELPPLAPGDVVSVSRSTDSQLPTHWWVAQDAKGQVSTVLGQSRPESPGARALALTAVPKRAAEILSYFDTIGERAGKLLPIVGTWRLSFWSRLESGDAVLNVEFRRSGAAPFFSRTLTLEREWKRHEFTFPATDTGAATALELRFRTSDTPGRILLDDVDLRAAPMEARAQSVSAFRAEVVAALKRLRPGYLRDWQGQLGDTLENRLAGPFARRASRYRPGGLDAADYGYSLPEFLDLCLQVSARPWVIIPTTFSDEELVGLGRFLAEREARDHFDEILLEFGNENWNAIFRPGGVANPRVHGDAAERAFRKIREGAGTATPLRMVVNGQHANPAYAFDFAAAAPNADLLAVAPYFLPSLQAGLTRSARLAALFAGDEGRLQTLATKLGSSGKELAVAEVNLHTIDGSSPPSERDPLIAGAAAGSALAKTLLDALALGARRQCVYVLAGYDTSLKDVAGLTKLWGIVRDLGASSRFRPTGLAVSMLNQIVAGNLHAARADEAQAAEQVSVRAFATATGWSAALASSSPLSHTVIVDFPPSVAGAPPRRLLRLDTTDPEATNETREDVRIIEEAVTPKGVSVTVPLPPWGLVVLLPSGGNH